MAVDRAPGPPPTIAIRLPRRHWPGLFERGLDELEGILKTPIRLLDRLLTYPQGIDLKFSKNLCRGVGC